MGIHDEYANSGTYTCTRTRIEGSCPKPGDYVPMVTMEPGPVSNKTKYEELELAFKPIHDEYTNSDTFKKWKAAKEAWEETESYKKKIDMHVVSEMESKEDWDIYLNYYNSSGRAYPSYGHNIKCPGHSQSQEKFCLKRKLLLIEYGLTSDTKLPSEWYWGGYEWDWS